jgi:hypothetical protein
MALNVGLDASFDKMWTGKEHVRKRGKLTALKLIQQMTLPIEITMGVTLTPWS